MGEKMISPGIRDEASEFDKNLKIVISDFNILNEKYKKISPLKRNFVNFYIFFDFCNFI